ncbi:hypothetical protein [Bartonella elizabethae]|nr:hypothetical protein [Bartonella elizabethae]
MWFVGVGEAYRERRGMSVRRCGRVWLFVAVGYGGWGAGVVCGCE